MTAIRNPLFRALGAVILCGLAGAQAVNVSARLSAGVVRLGDTASLHVTIENSAEGRITTLPQVEGLAFGRPSEPRLRQSTSFINGRVYSESTAVITVPLRPEAEGDYEIPPLSVEAGGRTFETRPLRLTVVQDIQGADFGFLEVAPSAPRVIEGQPFTVYLTFGWLKEQAVSFAQLNLPWWDSLPGAIPLAPPEIPQERRVEGILVNGRESLVAEQLESTRRKGREFVSLRIAKTFLPTRSGTLEFPTSFFEFGTRRMALFETRRESHFVQAASFAVEVVALPSEGQPLDFSGAVGMFQARASADARDVRVGDSIKFSVEWSGQGNLDFFRAPDPGTLDAFRGFRVYGSTEEKTPARRKVTYDLAPLSSDVQTIPALPLSVYDPQEARYETLSTEPLTIRVRPLEGATTLTDDEQRFERDLVDIEAEAPGTVAQGRARGQDRFLLGALVAVPLFGFVARAQARRRAGDPGAPLERRRRRARKSLERALRAAGTPTDLQGAWHEFLAARTREGASAWVGRDFPSFCRARELVLGEPLQREASALLAELEAAVWGGGAAPASERVKALARALEEGGL